MYLFSFWMHRHPELIYLRQDPEPTPGPTACATTKITLYFFRVKYSYHLEVAPSVPAVHVRVFTKSQDQDSIHFFFFRSLHGLPTPTVYIRLVVAGWYVLRTNYADNFYELL